MTRYQARLEAAKRKGQHQADEFNARFPVGTPVMAYPGVRPEDALAVTVRARQAEGRYVDAGSIELCAGLDTVTRTPAWILGDGSPVVSVEGHAGGIHLPHVDPVEPQVPTCIRCGATRSRLRPNGDRYPSGAQKFVCSVDCQEATS